MKKMVHVKDPTGFLCCAPGVLTHPHLVRRMAQNGAGGSLPNVELHLNVEVADRPKVFQAHAPSPGATQGLPPARALSVWQGLTLLSLKHSVFVALQRSL